MCYGVICGEGEFGVGMLPDAAITWGEEIAHYLASCTTTSQTAPLPCQPPHYLANRTTTSLNVHCWSQKTTSQILVG